MYPNESDQASGRTAALQQDYPIATGRCNQCGMLIYEGTNHPCKYDFEPTLRDQFAMAALTGILAAGVIPIDAAHVVAYASADAMLEARKPAHDGELGRLAERERCAKIAEKYATAQEYTSCGDCYDAIASVILNEIRSGE